MKDNLIELINKDKYKPFYKRRIYQLAAGLILFIIIIIIIIIVSSSSSEKFSSNSFTESIEFIKNPDQGYYRPVKIKMTPDSFTNGTHRPDQIYHLRFDMSQFSGAVNSEKIDKKLTTKVLEELDKYLYKIKAENKNAVIRFCYDENYSGHTDIEPSLSMIFEHIKQLSPIMNKHLDTLTALEAGMLGPWGEMHSSKIATNANKALVFKYWLENTKDIPILARTPDAIYTYFNKTFAEMEKYTISKSDKGSRLGIFNDCFLSSFNDYYTYVYDRKREIKWLSTISDHLPFGGEVCHECNMSDLENAIPEMRLLSLSHLNMDFNTTILNKWKNLKYNSKLGSDSLYYGMSGYDYVNAHFGYRLVIRKIDVEYKKGGKFELNINIENVGFGNMLKTKKVDIIYTDLVNKIISREEVGQYKGENSLKVEGKLLEKDHEEYKVFIRVYSSYENNIVYYPVHFANNNIYDDNIKANLIFFVKKGGEIYKN